jgi:ribonuclease-3 family protein
LDKFLNALGLDRLTEEQVKQLPPPVLAYIGDAAYELYVRLWSAGIERGAIIKHHRRTVQHVKATAQATILINLSEVLTEEEQEIVRKGRNVKSGNVPKNTPVGEYRMATGFEALMGYLYMTGRHERLGELIAQGLSSLEPPSEKA